MCSLIITLANALFTQGRSQDSPKHAIVHPRLEKPFLDPTDIKAYRPISNLSFISKTVEQLVVNRLAAHVNQHNLLPVCQSAYQQHHLTETAVISVHNDIV